MDDYRNNNKTIAKNTIMLYIRMIITMAVSLYTSRVILQTLGVVDFGVYSVVGGVITMFSFFNTSMSGATSRFLTYELCIGDRKRLNATFSSSLILQIGIALLITVLCESIGIWFLENKLVIPEDRMYAARWVLQLSILSMVINVTQVPYTASIISHERMDIFAYIEIIRSILNLLIVYLLVIGNFDKLIFYAILICIVSTIITLIYRIVCLRRFSECKFKFVWEREIMKPMLSFSGWDLYGNMSVMARIQCVNMLLNMWFGPVMNAASDIATKIQNVVISLSGSVSTAIRPQIVKCYSQKENNHMLSLMRNGGRITFILMLYIAVPLIVESDYILKLWLGIVPEHTEVLLRYVIVWNLITVMNITPNFVVQAIGDVKFQSIASGTIYLSIIPVTYFCFKMGAPYWIPFLLNVITVTTAPLICGHVINKYIPEYSWRNDILIEMAKFCLILSIVIAITYVVSLSLKASFVRLMISIILSAFCTSILGYYVILPKDVRNKVSRYASNRLKAIYFSVKSK